MLGEYVGWRRALAIRSGLIGVLIILRPGVRVFSPAAVVPLIRALMFALYALLTRLASRKDSAETSFFYTGVAGAAGISLVAPFWWAAIQPTDWGWMAALCAMGATGHFLLIKAYEFAEMAVVQPFAYFQPVFVGILGVPLFDEQPDAWTLAGAAVILAAGLYTMIREARLGRRRF